MSIKHVSLKHGWFYHYRIHEPKTKKLCSDRLIPLLEFLDSLFINCPEEKFSIGPRSSSLRFNIPTKLNKIDAHEVSNLAEKGLKWGKYKTAHSNVQVFMLANDDSTLGVEVPIWLEKDELEMYDQIFGTDNPLSGHIDVLRIEDGKVWIWDYKPNAHKEKYASTQVFFYALMMSQRTGISLKEFRCGYFDDKTAYTFEPKIEMLEAIA